MCGVTTDLAMLGGADRNREIPMSEVSEHDSKYDCWGVVDGIVYNLTPFLAYHPGGEAILARQAGKDMTKDFNRYHRWVSMNMVANLQVGVLKQEVMDEIVEEEEEEET